MKKTSELYPLQISKARGWRILSREVILIIGVVQWNVKKSALICEK